MLDLNKQLNKEELNKQMVSDYNSIYGAEMETIDDILELLSEEFSNNYDYLGDAQDAFNLVADEYSEFMNKYCFVYSLSGDSSWSVSTGCNYKEEDLDNYLKIINDHYGYNDEDLDDILSTIENDICNTMSNVGCDMFTALNLILSEDLYELDDNVFIIEGAHSEPKIEILY